MDVKNSDKEKRNFNIVGIMTIKKDLFNFFKKWEKEFANKNRFSDGDLSFLAVTSKFEFQLRDMIACYFHSNHHNIFLVAREWRRFDLALLSMEQQNKPIAIMEFKAVSSADSIRFFKKQLDADYKKLFNFTDRKYNCAIERYLILCVNLPDNKIEDNYKNVVKYSRQINIFWDSYSTFKKRLIIINTTLKDILPKNLQKNMHRSIIKIGKYYKVPIRLVVYIIGPF